MKKQNLILFILVIIISLSGCKNKEKIEKINLTEEIFYEMPIKNPYFDETTPWYYNNIEKESRLEFINLLISTAKSGEYTLLDYQGKELDPNKLMDAFCFAHPIFDSISDTLICYEIEDIAYLEFEEKWEYDKNTGKIFKEVHGISPCFSIEHKLGYEGKKFRKIFSLQPKLTDSEEKEYDKVITERIVYDAFIINPHIQMKKENYNAIALEKRKEYINSIFDKVKNEEIQCYDYYFSPIPAAKASQILYSKDTIQVMDPNPPYDTRDTVIENSLNAEDITKIRFMEKWSINTKSMEMHKEVIGISFFYTSYIGDIPGYMHVFWIFFDEDYQKKLMDEKSS